MSSFKGLSGGDENLGADVGHALKPLKDGGRGNPPPMTFARLGLTDALSNSAFQFLSFTSS